MAGLGCGFELVMTGSELDIGMTVAMAAASRVATSMGGLRTQVWARIRVVSEPTVGFQPLER